jgi:hypothetical protein
MPRGNLPVDLPSLVRVIKCQRCHIGLLDGVWTGPKDLQAGHRTFLGDPPPDPRFLASLGALWRAVAGRGPSLLRSWFIYCLGS